MDKKTNLNLLDIYPKYSAPDSGGDKGTAHSYMEIYSEMLKPKADLLEIGVWEGHSLAMFQEYFAGFVLGLDIDLSRLRFEVPAVNCNATNREQVAEVLGNKKFDYVIDDGSHKISDQLASLEILWDYLKPGGIYFIEDVQSDRAILMLEEAIAKLRNKKHWVWDLRNNKGRSDDILIAVQKVN